MKTKEQLELEALNDMDWVSRLDAYIDFVKSKFKSTERRLEEISKTYVVVDKELLIRVYEL